jgi:[ribosomal protein S18]-alanine N-acetyltransferase
LVEHPRASWAIRGARAADLDRLVELVEASLEDGWSRAALEEAIAAPTARIRLAEAGVAEPGGFVVARRVADVVEIDLLGVSPECRRRGAAAALLEELIQSEAALGATELRLELRASNASAWALYSGLGFVVVGRRSRYYPDGEDALLLTRALSTRTPEG